jgi:hypothetical protein
MSQQASRAPNFSVDRPPSQSQSDGRGQLGRRTFLMKLGVGTAAIAGYFVPGCSTFTSDSAGGNGRPASTLLPRLRGSVSLGRDGDMTTLRLHSAEDSPLCAVNHYGADVVGLLDGRHTVPQIASILADRMEVSLTEAIQSQIAYFITQVGEMGFLQEPYYAYIVETREG